MVNRLMRSCYRPCRRCGAATVEMAIVFSLFLTFVWALFEFGRMAMVANTIVNAAQEGARAGVVPGSKSADVTAAAGAVLTGGYVAGGTVTISPPEVAALKNGDAFTVTVQVPLDQTTWLPAPQFLKGRVLRTSCTMVREAK